jgi:hypothetical protein
MAKDETYFVVVNTTRKTFNVFDEDNVEFIPNEDWTMCKIIGEENCEAVMGLLFKVLPDYEQVRPNF